MIAAYLVLKLALQAVVTECNRIAVEAETGQLAAELKARVAQLDADRATGLIDDETYNGLASKILDDFHRTYRPEEGGP